MAYFAVDLQSVLCYTFYVITLWQNQRVLCMKRNTQCVYVKEGMLLNNRWKSILSFALFSAWLLSFAYEGQILYALLDTYSVSSAFMIPGAIICHAIGLFICGFIVKSLADARKMLLICLAACFVASGVFFLHPSALWTAALFAAAFFGGLFNAAWGQFLCSFSLQQERMGTVAAGIAIGTTIMVGLNMSAIHLHPYIGLGLAMLFLAASAFFITRIPIESTETALPKPAEPRNLVRKPLVLLCAFIFVVTIAAGLMFQSVNPAFAHLTLLTSLYWALPYIAAFIVVARLPRTTNREHILYIALAMIGFGFLAFMLLDNSAGSYLLVNTLLLGAFGVTDLFWWSILGEIMDYYKNPPRIFGLGLSVNLVGVVIGGQVSALANRSEIENIPTIVSVGAVFAAIIILPVLLKSLTSSLKSTSFLHKLEALPPEKQKDAIESFINASELTQREREIVTLLLKGYTYRLIAQELFISESTVKTHMQNIYFKLNVRNKTELLQKLMK